jgi:hypothetical protein
VRTGTAGAAALVAVSAVSAVAALSVAPAAAGTLPAPAAAAEPDATCPATVILAARGSEENDVYDDPAVDGPVAAHSNGWEGDTLHRFLTFAATVHPDLFTSGAGDVYVLGVDADHYPARLPLPGKGEQITLPSLVDGAVQFSESFTRGIPGTGAAVQEYEAASGCRPDYITLGYSQGEAVLLPTQHDLAGQGRLRGVMAFGNPLQRVPQAVPAGVPTESWCAPLDVVCDTSPASVVDALTDDDDAGTHADYFKDTVADPAGATAGERHAADTLAAWLA